MKSYLLRLFFVFSPVEIVVIIIVIVIAIAIAVIVVLLACFFAFFLILYTIFSNSSSLLFSPAFVSPVVVKLHRLYIFAMTSFFFLSSFAHLMPYLLTLLVTLIVILDGIGGTGACT